MLWYGGSVAEAVTLSKQRNAIFVVFIEGDNELSLEMSATINEPEIVKRLSDPANFLAIKLKSGSANYTHFAQIYQFVPVPSLFFIGRNGTPLEVVCAGVQAPNLAGRIDRILDEHQKDKPITPSTSGQDVKQMSADLLAAEAEGHNASSSYAKGDKMDRPEKKPMEEMPAEPPSGPSPPKVQKTEFVEVTRSGKEYEVVCEGDVCRRVPKVTADGAGPSSANVVITERRPELPIQVVGAVTVAPTPAPPLPSAPPLPPAADAGTEAAGEAVDDKVEKAKELIEARRREKAAKEKELERQKELERRALGQGVNELKKWQADQELKQIQDERKREKLENNRARQRILEQIALDRAERRARDQPPPSPTSPQAPPATTTELQRQLEQYRSERRARAQPDSLPLPPAPATAPAPAPAPAPPHTPPAPAPAPPHIDTPPGDRGAGARIQFKLPDGSSHTAHFEAEGTLALVHTYVAENLQLSQSNFALWTAFPRRELTEPSATLRSLQLTPSAALLILPRRQSRAVTQPSQITLFISFITQLFTQYVLEPSRSLYSWLEERFFPRTTGRASSPPPRAFPALPGFGPSAAAAAPAALRRRGNIHRLGENQQDDDNNTWNGNSTQQM